MAGYSAIVLPSKANKGGGSGKSKKKSKGAAAAFRKGLGY